MRAGRLAAALGAVSPDTVVTVTVLDRAVGGHRAADVEAVEIRDDPDVALLTVVAFEGPSYAPDEAVEVGDA